MSNCKHCGHCVAGCSYCACCGKCERCGQMRAAPAPTFVPYPYPYPYYIPYVAPAPITVEPYWWDTTKITCGGNTIDNAGVMIANAPVGSIQNILTSH